MILRDAGLAAIAALAFIVVSGSASAHHGTSGFYDKSRKVRVEGVVQRFDWRNPHCGLILSVTDESGKVVTMALETGSPISMSRLGFRRNTIKPGDHVVAQVFIAFANPAAGEAESRYIQVNGEYVAPQEFRDMDSQALGD